MPKRRNPYYKTSAMTPLRKYTNGGNVEKDALSLGMTGMTTGASIGSVIPGLGTLAGAGIGLGAGLVGGALEGIHTDKKIKEAERSDRVRQFAPTLFGYGQYDPNKKQNDINKAEAENTRVLGTAKAIGTGVSTLSAIGQGVNKATPMTSGTVEATAPIGTPTEVSTTGLPNMTPTFNGNLSSMSNPSGSFKRNGGQVGNPNYEAEGKEFVIGGNPNIYNGGTSKRYGTGLTKLEGNSHEQGGMPMRGGDYVISAKKSFKVPESFLDDIKHLL